MATADVSVDQIFAELAEIQRSDPACSDLLQFRSRVTAEQYRRFYDVVRRYVPNGAEVLDWGCGNGHASYGLSRMGYQVSGFSFEPCGLSRHCGERYRFVQGDEQSPELLPFDDDSFDAVVSVGVLEHVRETGGNEASSLREIARVLRPGGWFVCYHFPNRYSLIEAMNALIPSQHHHTYRYRKVELRSLCAGAGLELVHSRLYGALPRNAWHRAPAGLRDSAVVAGAWNLADEVIGAPLRMFCQNHLFVARRPG